MSKLDELIQQYCQDGVEYKPLGDVCIFADGFPLKADDIKGQGIYPVVKIGNINNGVVDEQDCYLTSLPSKVKTSQILSGGEILVGMSGSTGKTGYSVLQNAIVNQRIAIIRNNDLVLNGYLKHSLVNNNFESYCFQKGTGPQHNISKFDLLSYKIPVPPLPVQEEIVRILDSFTELQAELQAELQKRKLQYNYYLDNLLNFNRGGQTEVRWMKMKDIGKVCMCKRILKSQTSSSGGVPFFKIGTFGGDADAYISQALFNEYKAKYSYPQKGDILISAAGTIGRTIVFDGTPSYFQDSNIVWLRHDESIVLNSYLRFCYTLNPWVVSTGGTIARLYNDNILEATIPVPSLADQQKIVSILDRFDRITNDLTAGLPAEIEKRRQQYEYYRDKLLTFKRKEA